MVLLTVVKKGKSFSENWEVTVFTFCFLHRVKSLKSCFLTQMLGKHTRPDGHVSFFARVAPVTVLTFVHKSPMTRLCSTTFRKSISI